MQCDQDRRVSFERSDVLAAFRDDLVIGICALRKMSTSPDLSAANRDTFRHCHRSSEQPGRDGAADAGRRRKLIPYVVPSSGLSRTTDTVANWGTQDVVMATAVG